MSRRVLHVEFDIYQITLDLQTLINISKILEKIQALRIFLFHVYKYKSGVSYRMNIESFFRRLKAQGFRLIYTKDYSDKEIIYWELQN